MTPTTRSAIPKLTGDGSYYAPGISIVAREGRVVGISYTNPVFKTLEILKGKRSPILYAILNKDLKYLEKFLKENPTWLCPLAVSMTAEVKDRCIEQIKCLPPGSYQWTPKD